jgi:putative nucleotidyltransferase with HDIG domain
MVAGMAVIDSLNNLSKRSQLFRCTVIVFAVYAISYLGYTLFTEGDINKISVSMLINLGINSVLLLFSYLLIYIFERMFGFLSSVTLVELSDINSPLLQKLSEEAPGTFQHAMQVSNLAAAAANHVRGNAQLVRTGALYHDIGKLSNPAFFTENQSGANSPHKNLDIIDSARIIISHVDEGIKMAQKYGLPLQVQEFIATHHGHGKAKYFYNTYCNQHPGEVVDESLFTYPGHNPQTKETGIMMMADAVEAASRSLKEYNRESISRLVNNIIDAQISEGLLKETPLSFRDVETIKETFVEKLMTIYHTRIAYPTLNK